MPLWMFYILTVGRHLTSSVIVLLTKLSLIGIGEPLLGWISDVLSGRRMKVVVHGSSSLMADVTNGVLYHRARLLVECRFSVMLLLGFPVNLLSLPTI